MWSPSREVLVNFDLEVLVCQRIDLLSYNTGMTGRPPYLASLLHNYSPPRTMRSSSAKLLTVPHRNLSLGSHAFRISAPTTWNSLPQTLCDCSSLASFWNHLKTHYFSSAFSALWHLIHMCLDYNLTRELYKWFTYLLTYLLSEHIISIQSTTQESGCGV